MLFHGPNCNVQKFKQKQRVGDHCEVPLAALLDSVLTLLLETSEWLLVDFLNLGVFSCHCEAGKMPQVVNYWAVEED